MNDSNKNHSSNGQAESAASSSHVELQDRLVEQGLQEVLGDTVPPDLSDQILAAIADDSGQNQTKNDRKPVRYLTKRVLGLTTLAASLFVLGTFLFPTNRARPLAGLGPHADDIDSPMATVRATRSELADQPQDNSFLTSSSDGSERGLGTLTNVDGVLVDPNAVGDGEPRFATPVPTGTYRQTQTELLQSPAELSGVAVVSGGVEAGGFAGGGGVAQSTRSDWGITAAGHPVAREGKGISQQPASGPTVSTANRFDVEKHSVAVGQTAEFDGAIRMRNGTAEIVNVENARGNLSFFASHSDFEEARVKRFGSHEQPRHGLEPPRLGDRYARIHDNPFIVTQGTDAVSTFSIDVDTASYANVRQFILRNNCLPPAGAVRIEELVNYFSYDYAPPAGQGIVDNDAAPFAAHVEVADCPWQPNHRLVCIGLKGRVVETDKRPLSNLVFLVDVSGSMNEENKLPLVVDGLKHMTRQLGENDRVAIVVYASSEGLALPSTLGTDQNTILSALDNLRAGGSTAGGAGIQLAYQIAEDNFIQGGVNRVILCTDGDFNVGVTGTADLQRLAERKAHETKVFLTALGFGRGNLNDEMMEAISNKGNGNYHYVDNFREARRVLVDQMSGTLVTIAKDVKIQVEFNPAQVASYRLIGYENRLLAREDFDDDTKDAGEIGAGHTVTALYQVRPAGRDAAPRSASTEPLKYQQSINATPAPDPVELTDAAHSDELLTLRLRYKPPTSDTSKKLEFPITDSEKSYTEASEDFQFAAAVASFGMLMRRSQHAGNATLDGVLELAEQGLGDDPHGYRTEFIEIIRRAKSL